jgi:hypothetical protein
MSHRTRAALPNVAVSIALLFLLMMVPAAPLVSAGDGSKPQWDHPIKVGSDNGVLTLAFGDDVIKLKVDVSPVSPSDRGKALGQISKNYQAKSMKSLAVQKGIATADLDSLVFDFVPVPMSNKVKFNITSTSSHDLVVKITVLDGRGSVAALNGERAKVGRLTLDLSDVPGIQNGEFVIHAGQSIDPFVSYDPSTKQWVFDNADDFQPSVRVLTSGANVTVGSTTGIYADYYTIRTQGSWSHNASAQYYRYTFTVGAPSSGGAVALELAVPDSYMGLDVYEGSTLMTGNTTRYALSVPYLWNATSVTSYDWGSLVLGTPSGSYGTLKRVQLVLNMTASEQRTVTVNIKYTSTPSIGFDGVNDYINVPNSPSLNPSSAITVVAWFKTDVVHNGAIVWKPYYTNDPAYGISYFGKAYGTLVSRVVDSSGILYDVNFLWSTDDKWHHLALSYDGSAQRIYLDNQLKNLISWSGSIISSTYAVRVGDRETAHAYFNGLINDVRIYNISLSSTDIQQLYQGTYTNTTGLVLWISANSWNGTHFVDLSGNNNHGTPYGNVQYKVWTQNGFSTTYVGDPTDPAFTSAVYGAFLEYSSASVNVAPKIGVTTSFNWTHPVYGSTGNFTFVGNGTYVHYVTINGTNLFTRVVPIGYLTGSYYAVQVHTITAPSQYPLVYSISGCNLTSVNYASQSLSIITEAPSNTYGIITIYSPSEPWQVWKGDITLQPISYSQLGLTDGYCYYGASRMLYVSVRHSSPVTIVINYQEAPVTGGSGSSGGQPDKSSQTAPISVVTLPSISISSIAVPTVLLVLAAATAATAAIAFRGRGQRGGRRGKGGRGR